MNEYELQRLENLKQKQKLLSELNLNSKTTRIGHDARVSSEKPPAAKKRKLPPSSLETPSRASARIASAGRPRPTYGEGAGERYNYTERRKKASGHKARSSNRAKKGQAVKLEDEEEEETSSLVPAKDAEELRAGWSNWTPTGPCPMRDPDGTFHFADHPTFTPNKSPWEVLRERSFGGSYFRPLRSRRLGIVVADDWRELPAGWCAGLDVRRYLTSPTYDADANKFKVACGQSIEEWEAAGWIAHEYDVRGWFQWYCRFFQGRRCGDDDRQVARWRKCVGERGRWRRMLLKRYQALGVREVFDDGVDEDVPEVSPVMHQTCHHWAFEVRQNVLDEFYANYMTSC